MDSETLSLLGFPQVLQLIRRHAQSPLGKAAVEAISPSRVAGEIETRLAELEEARRCLAAEGRLSLAHLEDPETVLQSLAVAGQVLDPKDLLLIRDLLAAGEEARKAFHSAETYPVLSQSAGAMPQFRPAIAEIERVIDPDGEIKESAHPELRDIRRRQGQTRSRIQEHLKSYLTGSQAKYLINEPYLTERNGRFVIPTRVEHQREIDGVAHGSSSSGATVFLEPLSVIPLNNERLYLEDREKELIFRILRELTQRLHGLSGELAGLAETLAHLDLLFACAEFAKRWACTMPRLSGRLELRLTQARHPLLLESLRAEKVVPVSLELGGDSNVLVISGPNAGGKTAALKTAGLFCLMAQAGLPVPAAEAVVPMLQQILADIGDHQSISEQLSTFSAHVLRVRQMMTQLDPPSLILIDEIGTGTDPTHGAALGIAVIDHFRERPTLVIATTHHQAIKQYASVTRGVKNASVELDAQTLQPTYTLTFGTAGVSSGLEVAAMLGMPSEVVARARSLLSERDLQLERYQQQLRGEIRRLNRLRQEIETERESLKAQAAELERRFQGKEEARRKQQEEELDKLQAEFRQEGDRYIKSLKDRFEAARARKEARQREALLKEAFRRKMDQARKTETADQSPESQSAPVSEGDTVFHSFFRQPGTVVALKENEAVVEVAGKRITAPLNQLTRLDPEGDKKRRIKNVVLQVVEQEEAELNLVGCRVDEAVRRADKFLDRAVVSEKREVRLIHGFGTGTLRQALADLLKDHPHVESFQTEGGATLVQLR